MSVPVHETISLTDQLRNLIDEARMLLPGLQALFGFQTIAVFNQRFADLAAAERCGHLVALSLVVLSIALLMTPAAYHRIVEPQQVSAHMLRVASWLVCVSLLPLALALALDMYVVMALATGATGWSIGCGAGTLALLAALWFVFPFQQRRRRARQHAR
jgi:hypothetical protein